MIYISIIWRIVFNMGKTETKNLKSREIIPTELIISATIGKEILLKKKIRTRI